MSEKQTRKDIIDKRLNHAGWDVDNPVQVIKEHEVFNQVGTTSGIGFSDYVLMGKNGKPIAVVEAKKSSVDARIGREQAKQYADGFEKAGFERPFIFCTNGHDIEFWDDLHDIPRKVYGFFSIADLEELLFKRKEKIELSTSLIDTNIAGRPYQIEGIRRVLESFTNNHRSALMVMATGTGKTRTSIATIDVLMRSSWVKRVLFLADRNALLRQAKNAFTEHLPNAPRHWVKNGKFPSDKRVYLATYPSMLNLYHKVSPGFFDLIVCDESHRSIYKRYKEILDHFYSFKLGLTATPIAYMDRNTFKLFETSDEEPTYNFSYNDALENDPPYLVPYKVLSIKSRFQMEGIKSGQLPVSVQKKLVEEGKDLAEIDFEGTDLEKKVTNSGTNEVIVREFMEESIKDLNGVDPGKTIIFAISHNHAIRLEETFNRLYPQYKGVIARVIDSHDPRSNTEGGLLDQFRDANDPLKIAISVDMLDTGIDVPEAVNLVFAKPVFSRPKFWQMIGRGTRLCPNLFGPDLDKSHFLIIDHWDNFAYFDMHPEGKEPSATKSVPEKLFEARLRKAEAIIAHTLDELKEKIIIELRDDIAALPMDSVTIKDQAKHVEQVSEDAFWSNLSQTEIDYLRKNILGLMRTRFAEDYHALRFDIDVLETQIGLINQDKEVLEKAQENIQKKISELPLSLNQVRAKENVISKVKSSTFWTTLSEKSSEEMRLELRGLMRHRNIESQDMETLNLDDMVLVKDYVEFGPEMEQATVGEYRKKLEAKLQALLQTNEVLQRLKNGETLDEVDLEELSAILQGEDPYVTLDILKRIYDNRSAKFIDFIKHILGLQKLQTRTEVITKAFDHFISEHNDFTAAQINFLKILKSFMLERGKVSKPNLVQAPFTNFHPDGIRGMFLPAQLKEILSFIEEIGEDAA